MSALYDTLPATPPTSPPPPRRMGPRVKYVMVLILVTGLSLLYLSQTSDLAATSYDVAALQDERSVWQMRNEQLRLQIAELQSLDRVDQVASTRLGMGPPTHVVYVSAPAQPIVVPTPAPTSTPSAAPISVSSLRDILKRLQTGAGDPIGR